MACGIPNFYTKSTLQYVIKQVVTLLFAPEVDIILYSLSYLDGCELF